MYFLIGDFSASDGAVLFCLAGAPGAGAGGGGDGHGMVASERRATPPWSPAMGGFCRPNWPCAHCGCFSYHTITSQNPSWLAGDWVSGAALQVCLHVANTW